MQLASKEATWQAQLDEKEAQLVSDFALSIVFSMYLLACINARPAGTLIWLGT